MSSQSVDSRSAGGEPPGASFAPDHALEPSGPIDDYPYYRDAFQRAGVELLGPAPDVGLSTAVVPRTVRRTRLRRLPSPLGECGANFMKADMTSRQPVSRPTL